MANAPKVSHPLKEIFKSGKVALGLLTRLARSGDIARIAKTTGHDFVFLDGQHAAYSIETIAGIAQVALGIGISPLVRVRSCDDPQTQVLLDVGATGIVFPDVNTAAEAKRAVNRSRFPPVGRRSIAGTYAIFDYRPLPGDETVAAQTENTLVVCMIETPEGLENAESIAAVEGVDVIHVGLSDLLTAMGKPGAYGSPEHLKALDHIFAAAKKHGKVCGVGGDRNVKRQMDSIRNGAQFLTTNSDIAFLMAEASRVTGELRTAMKGE
jgi:2-keto-3-deoxy-L-rhamnonate aldolase RhmA